MAYPQRTIHTLCKKLLRLYPREFREQLGESMQQTFNDLCKEGQRKGEWFGLMLLLVPVLFILAGMPIVRSARAGSNILANPILLLIDQLPCFLGVPNCD